MSPIKSVPAAVRSCKSCSDTILSAQITLARMCFAAIEAVRHLQFTPRHACNSPREIARRRLHVLVSLLASSCKLEGWGGGGGGGGQKGGRVGETENERPSCRRRGILRVLIKGGIGGLLGRSQALEKAFSGRSILGIWQEAPGLPSCGPCTRRTQDEPKSGIMTTAVPNISTTSCSCLGWERDGGEKNPKKNDCH